MLCSLSKLECLFILEGEEVIEEVDEMLWCEVEFEWEWEKDEGGDE